MKQHRLRLLDAGRHASCSTRRSPSSRKGSTRRRSVSPNKRSRSIRKLKEAIDVRQSIEERVRKEQKQRELLDAARASWEAENYAAARKTLQAVTALDGESQEARDLANRIAETEKELNRAARLAFREEIWRRRGGCCRRIAVAAGAVPGAANPEGSRGGSGSECSDSAGSREGGRSRRERPATGSDRAFVKKD